LGSLPSAILWTWPCYVNWFCSITFIIVSSSPICRLIVTFLILSYLILLCTILTVFSLIHNIDVCKSIHNFMVLNINKARIISFSSHL
jgi:hypothetical protein